MVRPETGLLVAALLVLSGCAAIDGTDRRSAVTPAPVPTEAATETRTEEPTGFAARVARRHRAALSNTSYTLTREWTVRDREGHVYLRQRGTRRVAPGGGRFAGRYRIRASGHPSYANRTRDVRYWTNGSVTGLNYSDGPTRVRPARQELLSDLSTADRIRTLLLGVGSVGRHRTQDGTRRLVGSGVEAGWRVKRDFSIGGVHNVSLRLVVDRSGVVNEWRLRYDGFLGRYSESETIPVTVVQRVEVSARAGTAVDRPAWVENATVGTG